MFIGVLMRKIIVDNCLSSTERKVVAWKSTVYQLPAAWQVLPRTRQGENQILLKIAALV